MVAKPAQATSERSLLKEKAYSEIKQKIQAATFAPGSFLSERQLASLLGMSKTPIKAALERLEQEGFVNVSPQQGIVVRELSIQEIADQFELRQALEGFVVRSISGRLTSKQTAALERNIRQQNAAAAKGTVGNLVELDSAFHLLLCEALGNQAIIDCLMQHRSKMHRVIFQVMTQAPGRWIAAVDEHTQIFKAVAAGKPNLAVELLEQHLLFGKQHLLASKV